MAINPDPFTQVYSALWDLLEGHAEFTGLVKVANRIKYVAASNRHPGKPQVAAGDLPEVRIVPAGGPVRVAPSSTAGCAVTEDFLVQVSSGDERLQQAAYPVRWQVLRAVAGARDNLGLPFVKKLRCIEAKQTLADAAAGRGVAGWSVVLRVSVEMWFTCDDLA
jgi:hypothetical protein